MFHINSHLSYHNELPILESLNYLILFLTFDLQPKMTVFLMIHLKTLLTDVAFCCFPKLNFVVFVVDVVAVFGLAGRRHHRVRCNLTVANNVCSDDV